MKKSLLEGRFLWSIVVLGLALPPRLLAQGLQPPERDSTSETSGGGGRLQNPLGETATFAGLVEDIARVAVRIGFIVAVIFIIYSGLKFVMARGKPEELEKAKKNFLYVSIGTAILLGAYVIAKIIETTIRQIGG